jgi:hypothetical protein
MLKGKKESSAFSGSACRVDDHAESWGRVWHLVVNG